MNLSRLTPTLVAALPLERRAVEILRSVVDGEQPRGTFFANRRNVRLSLEQGVWGGNHPEAARAYEEAFDWLGLHGLISREPSQDGPDWFFVTERGWDVVEGDAGLARLAASERLGQELHPRIAERVRNQFLVGEVESAVFLAMREVEIRIRELGGADADDMGVTLVNKAFSPSGPGPLADPEQEGGEREATMALFRGAIGVFKNPSSHREVDFSDEVFASETILFADLLLRMLDRVGERLERGRS